MPEQETNQSKKISKLDVIEKMFCNGFVFSGGEGDPPAADPPAGDPPASDPPPATGVFTLPEQYRSTPSLQDVKSVEELCNKHVNLEKTLGKKRTVLIDETSTDDDVATFHRDRGVPDDHNTYASVNTKEGADTTFFDAMKPAFKKANMTAKDVSILEVELAPVLEKITGTKLEADKAQGEAFEALTDKIFAGTKENDLAQAKILMDAHTPEGLKKHMNELSNEHLAIVACVMKGVRAKYMNEDSTNNSGGGDAGSAEAIRTEGKKQIAIAQDPKSTMQQKVDAKEKANELYTQYDNMTKNNENK